MSDHPRIRGEHPIKPPIGGDGMGSSPHTRGARRRPARPSNPAGIIPAYAGSTAISVWAVLTASDHPRIRGEHATKDPGARVAFGSSPHTRGAPDGRNTTSNHTRIIPAYAGSTDRRSGPGVPHPDHPRIRGEHPDSALLGDAEAGSSPHTRGAPIAEVDPESLTRIIPAYAGSTQIPLSWETLKRDHPRIRGEHYLRRGSSSWTSGSSPHTRGAPTDSR